MIMGPFPPALEKCFYKNSKFDFICTIKLMLVDLVFSKVHKISAGLTVFPR